jgi:translocation and assembly module TamB
LRPVTRKRAIWRWLLWSAGIGLILVGLMVVSLPLWFPWVARPVLKPLGFGFATYRATSLTTFEMRDVRGVIGGVEIEAGHVEAWLPTRWVWHRIAGSEPNQLEAAVHDWEVRIRRSEEPREPGTSRVDTTFQVMDTVERILAEVRFWVPLADLGPGVVDVHGNRLEVEEAFWEDGRFTGTIRVPWFDGANRLTADVTARRRAIMKVDSEGLGLGVKVDLVRETAAWKTEGVMVWEENQVPITARFIDDGWLPDTVQLGSDQFRVPSERIGLRGFQDITGRFNWSWEGARFALEVEAEAVPETEQVSLLRSPLTMTLRGQGDLLSGTIDSLRVKSPWWWLELADWVELDWWSGRWLLEPVGVDVEIELGAMPIPGLHGLVGGRMELREGRGAWPEIDFELGGNHLVAWDVEVERSVVIGQGRWPQLEVQTLDLLFKDDSRIRGDATIDLAAGWVESGNWRYEGEGMRRFLPEGLTYSTVEAGGQVSGALNRLTHQGTVEAHGVSVPGLQAAGMRLNWMGQGMTVPSVELLWNAGQSQVALDGRVEVVESEPVRVVARIDEVTLTQGEQTRYRLAEPIDLEWRQAEPVVDTTGEGEIDWHLALGASRWTGPNRLVAIQGELDWPRRGHVEARVTGLVLADFLDLVPWPDRKVELQQMELIAGWNNSPVTVELSWNGSALGPEDVALALRGRIHGDGTGVRIEELTATTVLAPMLTVEGRMPVYLLPGAAKGWVQFDAERPVEVRATTDATGLITLPIGAAGQIHLSDPTVELELRGTMDQPVGHVRAELSRAEWRSGAGALAAPVLDRVVIDAVVRPEQVRLDRFDVEVDGQPVQVVGTWPLGGAAWKELVEEGRLPRWQKASGEVRIVDARLAPFARYLPEMLSPQGRLDLNITVRPGARVDGELTIVNAATRPMGPLTPIRDIEVRVRFDERLAIIERFGGQIGGQPVGVTGRVELTETGLPAFDLEVTGRNVPVVRRPGFLLRSDLDVQLVSVPDQPPRLSGSIRLRDGLFLQDIAALVTGRLERPPVRPPYFSVTNAPFADWRLDLQVTGDQFLRVRVPIFIGTISANGRLRGTMRDPVVTGDARIHSGRVIFPFGTLPVDQGYATLSERDPRGPVLAVVATGRNFRYHVRLEVEGTAEEPLIQFSSTPPLTSEEILLMLTAGELPQREIVYSTGARAGRLATYLGREMVTRFVGDETAEERIIINTGENIAEDGKTTYSIEYRLHPRWSVIGEYDRFNALNAGVKWRVYTR